MSSFNRDGLLWTIVVVVALTGALAYSVERPERLTPVTAFQLLETIVTLDGLLATIFVSSIWRWRMFAGWLVRVPNLQGTWRGTITPILDNTADAVAIAAILEIRQTLFSISCMMRTDETTSRSFSAAVFVDQESGEQQLTYSYSADPQLRARERNPRHDGTAVVSIAATHELALVGAYYTDRLTRGELSFRRTMQRNHL